MYCFSVMSMNYIQKYLESINPFFNYIQNIFCQIDCVSTAENLPTVYKPDSKEICEVV